MLLDNSKRKSCCPIFGCNSSGVMLVPQGSQAGLVPARECSACPSGWLAKLWKKLSCCCCWSCGKHRTNWWGWMCCPAWNSSPSVGGARCCAQPLVQRSRLWTCCSPDKTLKHFKASVRWWMGEEWHWLLKCKPQRGVWCCSQLLGIWSLRSRREVKGTVLTHLNIWAHEVEI